EGDSVAVLHWDRRLTSDREFQPSRRLILKAISTQQSVSHTWEGGVGSWLPGTDIHESFDWAFCTQERGESSVGWGCYVHGRLEAKAGISPMQSDPRDLRADL